MLEGSYHDLEEVLEALGEDFREESRCEYAELGGEPCGEEASHFGRQMFIFVTDAGGHEPMYTTVPLCLKHSVDSCYPEGPDFWADTAQDWESLLMRADEAETKDQVIELLEHEMSRARAMCHAHSEFERRCKELGGAGTAEEMDRIYDETVEMVRETFRRPFQRQ